jgi:hypothetical protein
MYQYYRIALRRRIFLLELIECDLSWIFGLEHLQRVLTIVLTHGSHLLGKEEWSLRLISGTGKCPLGSLNLKDLLILSFFNWSIVVRFPMCSSAIWERGRTCFAQRFWGKERWASLDTKSGCSGLTELPKSSSLCLSSSPSHFLDFTSLSELKEFWLMSKLIRD